MANGLAGQVVRVLVVFGIFGQCVRFGCCALVIAEFLFFLDILLVGLSRWVCSFFIWVLGFWGLRFFGGACSGSSFLRIGVDAFWPKPYQRFVT